MNELIIDKDIQENLLVEFFSEISSRNEDEVLITQDESEIQSGCLNIVKTKIDGDFQYMLSIYGLAEKDIDLAEILSEKFDLRCLISNDSKNPFTMIIAEKGRSVKNVFLDEEKLDEDIYSIKVKVV